ncbi:hypothetical protein VT84_08010 [Gemmata sp. SH-PL17]|nr:hypothetical protein VT84_08010 [Gemmata sp. SH-PL17]
MAKPLVSDALWERIEPLLPAPKSRRFRFPGRKPLDYRKVLTGIIFVLKTGIDWEDLPAELGWGCGKTCRNYLRAWQKAGLGTSSIISSCKSSQIRTRSTGPAERPTAPSLGRGAVATTRTRTRRTAVNPGPSTMCGPMPRVSP